MSLEKGTCAICGKERMVWRIYSPFAVKDSTTICSRCLGTFENRNIDKVIRDYICSFRGVHHPCTKCYGMGTLLYGSTATWKGGIAGAACTMGVCDHCWGSGDEYRHWVDLRKALKVDTAKTE